MRICDYIEIELTSVYDCIVVIHAKSLLQYFFVQVHYQLHSCTLKFLLKLCSDCDVPEDEKRTLEQEVMEALTQAQLPPLGTAMYDGVWEWVYGLVTEAERAELMSDGHISDADSKKVSQEIQPVCQLKAAAEEVQKDDNTMDTSTMMETSKLHVEERHLTKAATPEAAAEEDASSLPVSEETKVERQPTEWSPQETGPLGELQSPLSKTSSTSGRKSESDSLPSHDSIRSQLLQQCLYGVAVCSVRCPAFFKPLYRLASAMLALGLPRVSSLTNGTCVLF